MLQLSGNAVDGGMEHMKLRGCGLCFNYFIRDTQCTPPRKQTRNAEVMGKNGDRQRCRLQCCSIDRRGGTKNRRKGCAAEEAATRMYSHILINGGGMRRS
jgi:hypothetical protein